MHALDLPSQSGYHFDISANSGTTSVEKSPVATASTVENTNEERVSEKSSMDKRIIELVPPSLTAHHCQRERQVLLMMLIFVDLALSFHYQWLLSKTL